MFYHASQFRDIKILEPRVSNHGIPLIYFSDIRENVLVYLSNAIEKYCKENNFLHQDIYSKWGPYSFTNDGIIQIEEYYPNALYDTYKGVKGIIYHISKENDLKPLKDIPHAYVSNQNIEVDSFEMVEDAYEEIIKAEKNGKLKIIWYNEFINKNQEWLEKTIKDEYINAINNPEYRFFLEAKFPSIIKDI